VALHNPGCFTPNFESCAHFVIWAEEFRYSFCPYIELRLLIPATEREKPKSKQNQIWATSEASSVYDYLLSHRQLIETTKPDYKWIDGERPSSDLLVARMQAKYYGAGYIILRPYLFHALQWVNFNVPFDLAAWLREYNPDIPSAPVGTDRLPNELPNRNVTMAEVQNDPQLAKTFLWCCMKCIEYAMYSTMAFDGVAPPVQGSRPRVTNIHGTATA
jgi:hypothetical protein